jgi:DNA invertase Pin-like site-specific DNA recombinase
MNTTLLARQSSSRDERDPATQFQHAEAYADRQGWTVVSRHVEKSTSGGRQLEKRPGLLAALEDIRSKRASRVLVYHRDRLDRNLEVRKAFVAAVEEAGGEVWTPDGRLTFSTANEKLSNTLLGAFDENYREVIREKVLNQKRARVEAGCPCTRVPFIGYISPGGWSRLRVVEEDRPHVRRAFEMSADGKSSPEIVRYLREQGYSATLRAVTHMLRNELYCGHIVWGDLRHDNAHEAIVSDRLFRRAQARRKPVGRKSPSQRILARLGDLRCGSCGAAMVTDNKLYRCSSRECDCRASASANQVEALVLDRVAREIKGMRGHAGDVLTPALEEQERAQAELDKLRKVAALADDLEGLAAQIREAKTRVERANAAVDDARSVAGATWTVSSIFHGKRLEDPDFREEPYFEGMSRETLRDLLSTVFESVTIARREDGVALEDRVAFKLHETFDAQRPLDDAAADFAEVLPLLTGDTDLAADMPTKLLREAAAG